MIYQNVFIYKNNQFEVLNLFFKNDSVIIKEILIIIEHFLLKILYP